MNAKEMQQERTDNFFAVYEGKIPKRVPISAVVNLGVVAEMGNIKMLDAQWNPSLIKDAADKISREYYSDVCPYVGSLRWPAFYNILQSRSFVMSDTGFIQHPEVHCMEAEEYDEFIADPYACMVNKLLPRNYPALANENRMRTAMDLVKATLANNADFGADGDTIRGLVEKYGFYTGEPGSKGGSAAPFDFIADQFRSFSGICSDIRRYPEKVLAACDAVYPFLYTIGMPANLTDHAQSSMALHMGPFLKEKDFERYFWPSFIKRCTDYSAVGVSNSMFAENNWTHLIPYLQDLPVNSIIRIETGDLQNYKDKLGKRHILEGSYPLVYLRNHTKQECIDKAKEIIDIMAPGGRWIFNFDKGALVPGDFDLEKANAVTEYVRDNAVYDSNVGQNTGEVYTKEDYKHSGVQPAASSMWQTLQDQYASNTNVTDYAAQKLQSYEDAIVRIFNGLAN